MQEGFDRFLERGELVYLDRHIDELETKVCDMQDMVANVTWQIRDMEVVLDMLKKMRKGMV